MTFPLILTGILLAVVAWKWLGGNVERCPDCGLKRDDDDPICECGYVFEYPEDEAPLEYGDPDDES